jgi:hypothetical protein
MEDFDIHGTITDGINPMVRVVELIKVLLTCINSLTEWSKNEKNHCKQCNL